MILDWKMQYALRPEHIFVGPRRSGKTAIVTALREAGYWVHDCATTDTGEELLKLYLDQRRLYEADHSARVQPRMFFSDVQWWHFKRRFHHVPAHLRAEITFPEAVLESKLPGRDVDWLYRYAGDARGRLLPEAAMEADTSLLAGSSVGVAMRTTGAHFIEKTYPELVAPLTYLMPELYKGTLRVPRARFEARARSFRMRYPLPHDLTSHTLTDFLIDCGICEHTNRFYLRFPELFATGILELKNQLTYAAIGARLREV